MSKEKSAKKNPRKIIVSSVMWVQNEFKRAAGSYLQKPVSKE